jgi:hypothetical protein
MVEGTSTTEMLVDFYQTTWHYNLDHGFSNCGMHTTTGMQTIVYWYTALIKNRYMKKDNNLKRYQPHIFTNMEYAGNII